MKKLLALISLLPLGLLGAEIFKENLYKSLGISLGYYHYSEVGQQNESVMRDNALRLTFIGNLGYAKQGAKLEGILEVSYALGVYTGGILDVDNPERNGQSVSTITGALMGNLELKGGYNLLQPLLQNIRFYLQSDVGYFLNRNEFLVMDRVQGYLYVPIELEGEIKISPKLALNFLVGYRYFIFGNHFSAASKYGFTDDYRVTQKQGFGANAFIGFSYLNKNLNKRSVRLVYEHWSVGAADPMQTKSAVTGNDVPIYEPKNRTHLVSLQYIFGF